MTDAGERYAQHMEAASRAVGRGDRSAAAEALHAAVEATDGQAALHREHVAALNELSRLYVRQADYESAEPVLKRLLLIARGKGDRHPDVATALAGLAVAKGGQGHHAAAELLFRNALQIREQTLAPDHMATVITLEQLADTCAARGNFAEALIQLQRALLRRERVLGADHASVHGLRARIAQLERRTSESRRNAEEPAPAVASSRAEVEELFASARTLEPVETPIAPAELNRADIAATPAPAPRFYRRRTTRYASVGAALLVLASAGFAFASRAGHEDDETRAESGSGAPVSAEAAPPAAIAHPTSDAPVVATGGPGAASAVTTDSAPPSPAAPASGVSADSAPIAAAPIAPPSVRRLRLPKVSTPSLDSLFVSSTGLAPGGGSNTIELSGSLRAPSAIDDGSVTPPTLLGEVPTPTLPDALRARPIEGEVVVQFRVNEKGRVDVSSMQVLQSAHELLTAAVRNVLPRLRFEPARGTAPGSKPQAAWVQFRTRFAAGK